MAGRTDTKTRILDAAEKLFAERGFSETSLRLITSKAEVNLASVNYHFGSKKELIRAVLARYLDVFMPSAAAEIDRLFKNPQLANLNEIFSSLINPLLELNQVRQGGTTIFLQLLGRGYIESQGHLRWFITTHYGDYLKVFVKAVSESAPHIPPAEMFWRLHFTLGTIVFTMASADALNEIAEADYGEHNDTEAIIRKVIPYMAAGVSVPILAK
ncbi:MULTISPECIES: TetR/AcrR family transcriptional regulator [unclassified Shewanella]|uniref:TetR/AcrR family transcriptional regulator n=1 Tax=unclassified Shewanella TaxID=196818 RepID=UPI000970C293|nr:MULTISPECIES: TetR/AcrR family transcriptional regulator [unclassified Shewanella]MDO6618382.1 TetR/AcrR family transcriptional regulator [Shewanella sp. 6_MG-2023]MDO6640673.1 TetR/AcrR family transcriptional regulator [Shewanella sp. 5_MG-2023]MDO6680450.1 TetR/AcrR family transcriptional regulator [Shewanella sp. 4_MG-2023]PMG47366.1 TetR family transcriptional regulator [Shewanella sp. 10N.286.52.B9]PMH89390.1 TetR family transcriptional regulator [Shewanella sp. 10N.286.48.B5]